METSNMDKRQILKYVGDLSQLFGIKEYTLTSGKAKGIRAFDVKTGSGLEFTILADRCMDISSLSVKGTNCSYTTKAGIVSPEFYIEEGIGFLRNFFAGFLTTCGLRNVGVPCEDNGETFGIHGRISNTPAEEVCNSIIWVDGLPVVSISGKMREARLFGENLLLSRKITCRYGENKFMIQDTIENMGFREEPLMLLYHFNLGYPLLDEDAELIAPTAELLPRDAAAMVGMEENNQFQKPTSNYAEQVFYHNLKADSEGKTSVALINKKLELGVALHFNKSELFNFTQWKQMGECDYVVGMEPCNCYAGGRIDPRNEDVLDILKPGAVRQFDIEVEILEGMEDLNRIARTIENLQKDRI